MSAPDTDNPHLPDSLHNRFRSALTDAQQGTAVTVEFETGDPDGVFIGLSPTHADDSNQIEDLDVYIYVADPASHSDIEQDDDSIPSLSSSTVSSDSTPANTLFEETIQLNRISTELLLMLDEEFAGFTAGDQCFQREAETGPGGSYYTLTIPREDF